MHYFQSSKAILMKFFWFPSISSFGANKQKWKFFNENENFTIEFSIALLAFTKMANNVSLCSIIFYLCFLWQYFPQRQIVSNEIKNCILIFLKTQAARKLDNKAISDFFDEAFFMKSGGVKCFRSIFFDITFLIGYYWNKFSWESFEAYYKN